MNFILLTDNFHPTINSGSIIMGDLARELADSGNCITVITFVDKQANKIQDSTHGSVRVIRIRMRLRRFGMIGRLISEISYSMNIMGALKKIKNIECDVIICYSPSIFFGSAVKWIKKTFNVKAYLILRDIFPKWVVDAEIIRKGLLYRYFKRIESRLYDHSDFIGIESKSDIDYFKAYFEDDQLEVLYNWGSPIKSIPMREEGTRSDIIKILYGGNMGHAQDLFRLIKNIDLDLLNDKAKITLVGSGNQKEMIADFIQSNHIKSIEVLPEVKREEYLRMLHEADIGLVSLNKRLKSNNFPLKLMGYLQLSKPTIASVNEGNEIIDLIDEHSIGLVSIAGEKEELNNNLERLISDRKLRERQGRNAYELFNEKFTVHVAAKQILRRVQS
ncbi:glycosyltransferase family 4 protein [Gammaproteobacteria bacterium]|nr:glycosyltransferase family 4 protein [Gammaproteobacteria bacterium]